MGGRGTLRSLPPGPPEQGHNYQFTATSTSFNCVVNHWVLKANCNCIFNNCIIAHCVTHDCILIFACSTRTRNSQLSQLKLVLKQTTLDVLMAIRKCCFYPYLEGTLLVDDLARLVEPVHVTEDVKLVWVVGGVVHMQGPLGPERGVDKRLHLVSNVRDLRHSSIQLVHDLVGDGLDENGSRVDLGDGMPAVSERSRQKKVETIHRFRNPGDNLLGEFFQRLLSHPADGGNPLGGNVGDLGTRVSEDSAHGYLGFAARLGTIVDGDNIACCQGDLFRPLASPAVSNAGQVGVLPDRDERSAVVGDAGLARIHLPEEAGPGGRGHEALLPDVVLHLLHGGSERLRVGEAGAWGETVGRDRISYQPINIRLREI